ncbi:hypothetical protein ABHF33_02710 [Chitinibacter sp. FCG-7]|uniref:Copper resistance protein CopC n=1 Tax=Chitinibacter mangrovi TaxID=3153927 RepID=A0AAU7FBS3_9NEIS
MKRITVLICGLILSAVSWAHGDEDHGAAPHPQTLSSAAPSAETATRDFELLASMDGETLIVHLNHFADNRPVANAEIEVESGSFKTRLKAVSAGVYQASAAPLAKPGEHALALTVLAGEEADLLDTTLKVAAPLAPQTSKFAGQQDWLVGVGLVVAGLLLIVALALGLRRRKGHTS